MELTIKSTAFKNGGEIPKKYTCQGADISPPLEWSSGIPDNAKSLVLIVDDPDAPDPKAPRMTWVHWVIYDIPPGTSGIEENKDPQQLSAKVGLNDWGKKQYGGPCPPIGRHRYFFKLYALDTILDNIKNPVKPQIEAAMKGHIIAKAELIGTYQKG